MGWWPWSKGRKPRIRKDVGDLTPADYEKFPVWEFALDEEGVAGQNECTVRPVDPIDWPEVFDYIVALHVTFANGAVRSGAFQVSSFGLAEGKHPTHFSHWLLFEDGMQFNLYLAAEQWQSDEKARVEMNETYRRLGVSGKDVFPLVVRPLTRVPGLPEQWHLPGFRRAPHPSNKNAFLV